MASETRNSPDVPNEKAPPSPLDEKQDLKGDIETAHAPSTEFAVLEDERDIATHVITVTDDETLNPWTIRVLILGLGLSAFGDVLGSSYMLCRWLPLIAIFTSQAEIYYFKPVSRPLCLCFRLTSTFTPANGVGVDDVLGHHRIHPR